VPTRPHGRAEGLAREEEGIVGSNGIWESMTGDGFSSGLSVLYRLGRNGRAEGLAREEDGTGRSDVNWESG